MKLIELHILQSFPVSCLNRDDVGSPKSAVFGGVTRARLSSQSLKRAIRLDFNEAQYGNPFHTERTKLAHEGLAKLLEAGGMTAKSAADVALEVLSSLVDKGGAAKSKTDKNDRVNMPALIWLSPGQISKAADAILKNKDLIIEATEKLFAAKANIEKKSKAEAEKEQKAASTILNKALKSVAESIQKAGISDAADIAFFGRMVANDATLNVEAASMFSHALSTHATSNEIDFFTAVDDVKHQRGEEDETESEDSGAAMVGTLEFNSATYYRYTAINLDLLFREKSDRLREGHLSKIESQDDRKALLRAFITAILTSVPGARKNSMNGNTAPVEVLGIRKDKGQPLQLVNAFEAPVEGKVKGKATGFASPSKTAMESHFDELEKTWGPQGAPYWLSKINADEGKSKLDSFLDQLLSGDV